MIEPVINIANIFSLIFLITTLIILLVVRIRKPALIIEANWFYIISLILLALVTMTNLSEHFGINVYLDVYEDYLELLFIPFIVFAFYSTQLTFENHLRSKAEYFSSKVIDTTPAITFIYNLKIEEFTFIRGNLSSLNELKNKDTEYYQSKQPNNTITPFMSGVEWLILKEHLNSIKQKKGKSFPLVYDFEVSLKGLAIYYFQSHEMIFSTDENGAPLEIVGITIDITDKKLAENELTEYKNQLEQIVSQRTADLANANSELQSANKKLQKTNEELKILNEITQKQTKKIEKLNIDLLSQNKELEHSNFELVEKQNQLENTMQKLTMVQNQLIQSEKLSSLGVLMAGIAHEINNPVNYISNGLLGLKKSLDQIKLFSSEMINYFNTAAHEDKDLNYTEILEKHQLDKHIGAVTIISSHIQTGVDKIMGIVGSLKQYTHGKNENFERSNIHEIINSVLVMLYHEYKYRIEVFKNYGDIPVIECQPGKINQVIMNLISNSIQSITNKGTIFINTEYISENDVITIKIRDNGSGIPKDIQSKIFDPFFTTKEVGQGTGLGLSISYNIIESHNGKIEVLSSVDEGSEFTITLPVRQTNKQYNDV